MLWNDYQKNSERPISKWWHYFPFYEKHLQGFVNKSVFLLEIGCGEGGSLQMWRRHLGPLATIVGIDINPICKTYADEGIVVRIGDQADLVFLESIINEFGVPDVVIDDGSHETKDVNATFDFFYPLLGKNSIYIVEDLHTSYWEEFGGGIENPTSFVNRVKGFLDLINAEWTCGKITPTQFTKDTLGIYIYNSMVCFEKGNIPMMGYKNIPGGEFKTMDYKKDLVGRTFRTRSPNSLDEVN